MLTIGIDVGTSTVSGVVYDTETKEVRASVTVPGSPYLYTDTPGGAEQSPEVLLSAVKKILAELEEQAPGAGVIAFSTQMHGMLYIDRNGRPLSPLFTWEDKRADQPIETSSLTGNVSLAERISELTGYPTATGYALATHRYNIRNGLVPDGVWKMVTAGDYCAMKICEGGDLEKEYLVDGDAVRPVMHPATAASFGLYSIYEGCFDEIALDILDITDVILPRVGEYALAGHTPDGKEVYYSTGDNQAGFIGAAGQPGDILINIGTSAQISGVLDTHGHSVGIDRELDLRPYMGDRYLVTGAALAGGSVLKALNSVLLEIVRMSDPKSTVTEEDMYVTMERMARTAYSEGKIRKVDTRFSGTRTEPDLRGSVQGLSTENLGFGPLCAGFYYGIVKELYDFYCLMPREVREETGRVIMTGNAARKNPVLLQITEDLFGKKTVLSAWTEDAAVGAARYAALCAEHN